MINRLTSQEFVAVSDWIRQNYDRITGLKVPKAALLVSRELGFDVTEANFRLMLRVLGGIYRTA